MFVRIVSHLGQLQTHKRQVTFKVLAKITQFLDYCPIVFNEQIAIELSKVHSEALIQVQLAPIAVYFMPQSRGDTFMSSRLDSLTSQPKIQPSGWLTLDSLQFRGNGLYSDEEVPWKVEILEYAWLVEVIVGDIAGNIQPEHVSSLLKFCELQEFLAVYDRAIF
jgi:hypothetical protein